MPAAADEAFVHVETAAAAVLVASTQHPGLTPFSNGIVDSAGAYAAGVLDSSGGSQAQAAVLYPGALVVQGPSLLCQEIVPQYFGTDCPAQPPDYPLLAQATYPTHPHDTAAASGSPVGGSGAPLTVVPGRSEATAEASSSTADTQTASLQVLAGTPGAVSIDSAASSTTSTESGGAVTVTVTSVLHGVTIAGAMRVDTIRAVDQITASPGRKPVDRPHVTVTGVTVNGESATIDETGVHVAGQSGPATPSALSQQGVTVRLVGVDRSDHTGTARSNATGLFVTAAVPVQGVPSVPNPVGCPPDPFPCPPNPSNLNATYFASATLGSVGAVAAMQPGMSFDIGAPLLGGAVGSGSAPVVSNGGGGSGALPPSATGPAPGNAPEVAPSLPRTVLSGLLRVPLDALYAVLGLVTAALFVGWRATMHLAAGRRR
jgi:hypothetical protein